MKKFVIVSLAMFGFMAQSCGCEVVQPGNRGVVVNLGQVDEKVRPEGLQTYSVLASLEQVNVRQLRQEIEASCFSSDLQQVDLGITVLYRIPENQVIRVYRDFHGDPFATQVAPRVQESVKEATSTRSAEMIVKEREMIKKLTLDAVRAKVGDLLVIEDIIISNVALSKQLTASIESKMVQEQEAAAAKYTKQKAEMGAETAVATAKGEAEANLVRARAEAESIRIRGEAIQNNPGIIQLQLIEKWNGVSPQIVNGGNAGVNIIMPAASK